MSGHRRPVLDARTPRRADPDTQAQHVGHRAAEDVCPACSPALYAQVMSKHRRDKP